jgi:hypothetical protein
MSQSQGLGYAGAPVYPQASHVTTASFMTDLGADSTQIPRITHCTESVWVYSAHPIPRPSSSQNFYRYPLGTILGLPTFQGVSSASVRLPHLASGPAPLLASTLEIPVYYF